MNDLRLEKLSPLSGLVAVALLGVGAALFGVWDYLPSPDRLVEALTESSTAASIGGYLGIASSFFMIWFAGSLYHVLREREGGTGWLSTLVFGGGVASGVALALGFAGIIASAARAGTAEGITPVEAVTLYDLYAQVLGQAFAVGMALLIAATAAVSQRTALLPAWAVWVSVVVAIGLLTPFAYLFLAAVLVWLIAMSLWLYRQVSAVS